MAEIRSLPSTEEYRKEWERIFQKRKQREPEVPCYKSGCPILSEETHAD